MLVEDRSPLVRGHLLVVPDEHVPSILDLPESSFRNVELLVSIGISFLQAHFGEVTILEHGRSLLCSDIPGQEQQAHAHAHLIPTAEGLSVQMKHRVAAPRQTQEVVFKEYLYVLSGNGEEFFLALDEETLPHLVRREVTSALKEGSGTAKELITTYADMRESQTQLLKQWLRWCPAQPFDHALSEDQGKPLFRQLRVIRETQQRP